MLSVGLCLSVLLSSRANKHKKVSDLSLLSPLPRAIWGCFFYAPAYVLQGIPSLVRLGLFSQVTLTLKYLFVPSVTSPFLFFTDNNCIFFFFYCYMLSFIASSSSPLLSIRNKASRRFYSHPFLTVKLRLPLGSTMIAGRKKVTARSNLADAALPFLTFIIIQCHCKPNTSKSTRAV